MDKIDKVQFVLVVDVFGVCDLVLDERENVGIFQRKIKILDEVAMRRNSIVVVDVGLIDVVGVVNIFDCRKG